jgi:hypothetical protein
VTRHSWAGLGALTRQAAAALLKMAKTTTDSILAARLIEAAADLKDRVGGLPSAASPKAPDMLAEQ